MNKQMKKIKSKGMMMIILMIVMMVMKLMIILPVSFPGQDSWSQIESGIKIP